MKTKGKVPMKQVKRWKSRRGSILVETAFILPLLTFLLIGMMEFGRVLMIKQVLTNAAREGARVAAIDLDNSKALSSALDVTRDYVTRSGMNSSEVTVNPVFSQLNGTPAVQVSVDYNYTSDLARMIPAAPSVLRLHSQVVMRREA